MPARPQMIAPRPAAAVPPRGANMTRMVAREVKREAFQQQAARQAVQPRFAVRPAAPPQRVMPKQPAPAVRRLGMARPTMPPLAQGKNVLGQARPTSPVAPPKGVQKGRPGVVQPPMPPGGGLKGLGKAPSRPATPGAVRPGFAAAGAAAGAALLSTLVLNSAAAHPQISTEVSSLDYSLSDLRERSNLSQVQGEVTQLDSSLNHALSLLEGARNKGYVYQKDLDEMAYEAMDRWQPIRDQVLNSIPQQAAAFQGRLGGLSTQVSSLNAVLNNPGMAAPRLSSTSSQVNTLLGELNQLEDTLQRSYSDIQSAASTLTSRLTTVHWGLGQLGEAKFKLSNGENLVAAVQARWDQVGDQDPEGILYLTNRRLVFERKEKVATKKILFITTSQELVQEVLIDQPVANIKDTKAVNKGLFGHQDFLEVQFADAKLGAVPFHLNGQD
jgi:hypothetical protein